jgi:hypothetical protein
MYTNHCHRVFTQLQLTNISYHIILISEFRAFPLIATNNFIFRRYKLKFWEKRRFVPSGFFPYSLCLLSSSTNFCIDLTVLKISSKPFLYVCTTAISSFDFLMKMHFIVCQIHLSSVGWYSSSAFKFSEFWRWIRPSIAFHSMGKSIKNEFQTKLVQPTQRSGPTNALL